MSSSSAPSPADIGDRHRRLTALALLAVGVLYAAAAAGHVLDPGVAWWADRVEIAMALAAVLLLAPIFIWKMRNFSAGTWSVYQGADGVVAATLNRSKTASWVATFVTMVGLEQAAEGMEGVPADFYLEVGLAVMLVSFALIFLFMDRDPGEPVGERSGA